MSSNERDAAALEDAKASKLDWIVHSSGANIPERGSTEYKMAKLKENPFVPIGCLTTAFILCIGVSSMTWTDKRWSNWLMRARITSQGLTVAALLGGTYLAAKKKHPDGPPV